MPRRARVEVEGGVYHVYNRVASGEAVFGDPEEALRFVEEICRLLTPEVSRVASPVRASRTAEARRLIAVVGVEQWRQSGSEMARVLGKNPDVVSWWVGDGVRRRLSDRSFADRLEQLDEALSRAAVEGL